MNEVLPNSDRPWWRRDGFMGLMLIAATLAAYSSSLNGQFVWDDKAWTTDIEAYLRDTAGLWSMWTVPKALQQYYPLTGTTFWLDHYFWGSWTLPYHLENVLLHIGSVLLFWRLLQRLAVPGAWLAGAIFALHPVMVESVSWITERKNVLSLFFFLAALLAYGRFASFWQEGARQRRWVFYLLALLLFGCALLSKVSVFALPAVILLICWWKRGYIRWWADLTPTLPFFALAIADGLLVASFENEGASLVGLDTWSWPVRCLIAGRAFWFYPGKLIWPVHLCFVYPRWQLDPSQAWQWIFPITAVGALALLWFMRKRWGRGPAAAVFFYVGTLFPVMGFMNVFGMFFSHVWDHWVHLPSLGLIAWMAAAITYVGSRLNKPAVMNGVVTLLLCSLAVLTWRQGRMYRDMVTLWETALERNPACWIAHDNLGAWYLLHGRSDEAIPHFEQSIKLRPDLAGAHVDLGATYEIQGKLDEAIAQYQMALKLDPDDDVAHRDYASVLLKKGRGGEALTHLYYRDATLRPGQKKWGGLVQLAWILATSPDPVQRDGPIAVRLAQQANEVSLGKNPEVLRTLAAAYAESGRFAEAVQTAQEALALAAGNGPLAGEIAVQLKAYQAGTPFRNTRYGTLPPIPSGPVLPSTSPR